MWTRWPDQERLFSAEDREAIRRAAFGAERRTAGEVVPYVVGRCDDYPEVGWAAAGVGALTAAAIAGAVVAAGDWWGGPGELWITLPALAGALVGRTLVGLLPGLRRRLLSPELAQQRVERRAALAFLDERVFATRDRTGILILLAVFEHRVVVLADAGINARVQQLEWNGIVERLRQGIKSGRAAPALMEAIDACGRLLEERAVTRRADDADELANDLRISDA